MCLEPATGGTFEGRTATEPLVADGWGWGEETTKSACRPLSLAIGVAFHRPLADCLLSLPRVDNPGDNNNNNNNNAFRSK